MRKRRFILLLVIGVGVTICLLVAAFTRKEEPEYGGKRLSEWVEGYYPVPYFNGSSQARTIPSGTEEAIRHIGTNALPYLLRWISYETPAWKKKWYPVLAQLFGQRSEVWFSRDKKLRRRGAAGPAFRVLGPRAKGAIPELVRLMNDPELRVTPVYAADVLADIGAVALPAMVSGLTNRQEMVRTELCSRLARMGSEALPAVPALLELLNNTDPMTRKAATNALRQIQPEALEKAGKPVAGNR